MGTDEIVIPVGGLGFYCYTIAVQKVSFWATGFHRALLGYLKCYIYITSDSDLLGRRLSSLSFYSTVEWSWIQNMIKLLNKRQENKRSGARWFFLIIKKKFRYNGALFSVRLMTLCEREEKKGKIHQIWTEIINCFSFCPVLVTEADIPISSYSIQTNSPGFERRFC